MVTAIEPSLRVPVPFRLLTLVGALGVATSFAATVVALLAIESAGAKVKLIGADAELGYPSSALAAIIFAVLLTVCVAHLAGAKLQHGWFVLLCAVLSIGIVFEIWASYLAINVFIVIQLLLMVLALVLVLVRMPGPRPSGIGLFLVIASASGFFAAFRLTVDKVGTFVNPTVAPSCNFSVLVSCGVNLRSPEGSVFGFPNPLIGVVGWIVVLIVGILLLSGLEFARWFWIAANAGMLFAICFIGWLIGQSIYHLHTLCPWCMTTWVMVIPTFLVITLRNLKSGIFGGSARVLAIFSGVYSYVPLISLVCFVFIAVIAQVELDVIHRFR